MVPLLGSHLHGEGQLDLVAVAPDALQAQVLPGGSLQPLAGHLGMGALGPAGDAQQDRKARLALHLQADAHALCVG